jgi:hypothetical protein
MPGLQSANLPGTLGSASNSFLIMIRHMYFFTIDGTVATFHIIEFISDEGRT